MKDHRRLRYAVLLLLSLMVSAQAETNKGIGYYNKQDYQAAYQELSGPAESGDPVAQVYLGYLYAFGYGVDKDPTEGLYWIRKAADQGDVEATFTICTGYDKLWWGRGSDDDKKGFFWCKKSAEMGYYVGQMFLGLKYKSGNGVEQDYEQAVYWLTKAVKRAVSLKNNLVVLQSTNALKDLADQGVASAIKSLQELNAGASAQSGASSTTSTPAPITSGTTQTTASTANSSSRPASPQPAVVQRPASTPASASPSPAKPKPYSIVKQSIGIINGAYFNYPIRLNSITADNKPYSHGYTVNVDIFGLGKQEGDLMQYKDIEIRATNFTNCITDLTLSLMKGDAVIYLLTSLTGVSIPANSFVTWKRSFTLSSKFEGVLEYRIVASGYHLQCK